MPHQRRRHTESLDAVQNRCEQFTRHRHLGHLEGHILRVDHHLGPDLDQLLPQRRQRPVLHGSRQRQPTQKVAQVVRQSTQLEANLVVHEAVAQEIGGSRRG